MKTAPVVMQTLTAFYGKREWLGGWALGFSLDRAHMLTGGFQRPVPNAKFPGLRLHHKGLEKTQRPSASLLSFHKDLESISEKHMCSNVF